MAGLPATALELRRKCHRASRGRAVFVSAAIFPRPHVISTAEGDAQDEKLRTLRDPGPVGGRHRRACLAQVPAGQSCGGLLCDMGVVGHKVPVGPDGRNVPDTPETHAMIQAATPYDPTRLPCHDFVCACSATRTRTFRRLRPSWLWLRRRKSLKPSRCTRRIASMSPRRLRPLRRLRRTQRRSKPGHGRWQLCTRSLKSALVGATTETASMSPTPHPGSTCPATSSSSNTTARRSSAGSARPTAWPCRRSWRPRSPPSTGRA